MSKARGHFQARGKITVTTEVNLSIIGRCEAQSLGYG